jgi:hypothetical protein
MSVENSINQVMQNNHEFSNRLTQNIEYENDKSFNQLLALQLLIQKHSGLKELCKIYILIYLCISYKRKR